MIELGPFTPPHSIGPQRSPSGTVLLGRMTTTDEQWAFTRRWLREQMEEHKMETGQEAQAIVNWGNLEPSIVTVKANREHLSSRPVWFIGSILETTLDGREIPTSQAQRFAVLDAEVEDLHDKGLL